MKQAFKELNTYKIPAYAVNAIENGNYDDDLTPNDIASIKQFTEHLSQQCPRGYYIEWKYLNDSYFTPYPEFGAPTNVVEATVMKIVQYDPLPSSAAPIDGKNVGDEFDWWCNDEFTEKIERHTHSLLFWEDGCCCVLEYIYGYNRMVVRITDKFGGDKEAALCKQISKFNECCKSSEDLVLDYQVQNEENGDIVITGRFYFIEED